MKRQHRWTEEVAQHLVSNGVPPSDVQRVRVALLTLAAVDPNALDSVLQKVDEPHPRIASLLENLSRIRRLME